MKTPHKHAELIKAWAEGATIQFRFVGEDWATLKSPFWDAKDGEYRIKPEPKPDYHRYTCVAPRGSDAFSARQFSLDNLKLTFDGETGVLKSAEVL